MQLSRRSFFYFLTGGIFSLVFLRLRIANPTNALLDFFDLPRSMRTRVENELRDLRSRNSWIYRETFLFFSLVSNGLSRACPTLVREEVIDHWASFLFEDRQIAWPYLGYPEVDATSICSGLIRLRT